MDNENTSNFVIRELDDDDELIDVSKIINSFKRNIKIITGITSLAFILGCSYALIKKDTWEGSFQIVLKTDTNPASLAILANNPAFQSVVDKNFSTRANNLKTEVSILKSPSVLMNVYNSVLKEKKSLDIDTSKWNFKRWRANNLSIALEKGTSVLNISYRDINKEIVLPVLTRISKEYQNYSDRDRSRKLVQAISYVKEQILIYKEKSLLSSQQLYNFASDEELYAISHSTTESKNKTSKPILIDIDLLRIEATNEVKDIQDKINLLTSELNDEELILSQSLLFNDSLDFSKELLKLDLLIAKYSVYYQPNDPFLMKLVNQRKSLVNRLKDSTISELKSKLLYSKSKLSTTSRPQKILNKFKELQRSSIRDERTLRKLEDDYRILSLEKVKSKLPWDLITKPTLSNKPVSPNRIKIVFLSVFMGTFAGFIYSSFLDWKKGKIYDKNEFNKILKVQGLADLTQNNKSAWEDEVNFLVSLIKDNPKKLYLFTNESLNNSEINRLKSIFNIVSSNLNIIFISNIKDILNLDNYYFLANIGKIKSSTLINLKDKFTKLNKSPNGFILFD